MENPNALSLRALVVSDVHLAVKKVAAIAEWAKAESRRYVLRCLLPRTAYGCQLVELPRVLFPGSMLCFVWVT